MDVGQARVYAALLRLTEAERAAQQDKDIWILWRNTAEMEARELPIPEERLSFYTKAAERCRAAALYTNSKETYCYYDYDAWDNWRWSLFCAAEELQDAMERDTARRTIVAEAESRAKGTRDPVLWGCWADTLAQYAGTLPADSDAARKEKFTLYADAAVIYRKAQTLALGSHTLMRFFILRIQLLPVEFCSHLRNCDAKERKALLTLRLVYGNMRICI